MPPKSTVSHLFQVISLIKGYLFKMVVEMRMITRMITIIIMTIMMGISYVPVAGDPQKKSHLATGKVT